jgi:hypothetical protein
MAFVTNALAACFVDLHIGLSTEAMIVRIGIQVLAVEVIDRIGMFGIDVAVTDMFADNSPQITAPFLASAKPLSLLCRGPLLVCSMSSLPSNSATVRLINSDPLSV